MPLRKKFTKKDWDELPESVRAELKDDYQEQGEGDAREYVAKDKPDPNAEKLTKIRETADRSARRVQELEALIAKLPTDEDGNALDPEKLTELLEEARSAREQVTAVPTKTKEAVDKAVLDARKKFDREKAALEKERDEERAANHDLLVVNTVKTWVGANIHPDYQEEIEDSLLRRLNPEVRREVKDGKPIRTAVTKVNGFDEELVPYLDEKWKATDKAKRYLRSPDNSGGETGERTQPKPEAPGQTAAGRSKMTVAERSKYIDEHGEKAYMELPA